MLNDYELEAELMNCPQTKKTLLGKKDYTNKTEISKISKRLYRLCDSKKIGRGLLVGNKVRGKGEIIFFSLNKNYLIVVVETIEGVKHYYCSNMKDKEFGEQELCDCYLHKDFDWKYIGNKTILRNKILEYY